MLYVCQQVLENFTYYSWNKDRSIHGISPQTDGQTEIANRKVEEMIRALVNFRKNNCYEHLVDFEVAYNTAIHRTTSFSPFFLKYEMNPRKIPLKTLFSNNPSASTFLETIQEYTRFPLDRIRKNNIKIAEYANKETAT